MEKGDNVMFIGASEEHVKWGGNDDPNKLMKQGDVLEIESVEIHLWHTELRFVGITGKFNSVSFKPIPEYINPNPKKVSETDLKKALHELHEKQEQDRKQTQADLNKAFSDGFRCM